jgi:hypothetical protein
MSYPPEFLFLLELHYAWAEEAHQMRMEAAWHEGLWLSHYEEARPL